MKDVPYTSATLELTAGQILILYTDGITEAKNAERELFGTDGIERALDDWSGEPDGAVQSIMGGLIRHQVQSRAIDDQAIVALQVQR